MKPTPSHSPLSTSGQTSRERFKDAMKALKVELARLNEPAYIPRDALDEAKAHRAVSSAFGFERGSELTHTVGFWWSVADLDYFMGYVDDMARQQLADLRSYAERYIMGKARVVGIMISPDDRKALGLTEADLVALAGR